ncbi:MAG TPA: hypothetical protein VHE08_07740 [Solirubrobacterales bacterium]|nr:hypothetical protein [Solirubrobacterales bacterium]
MPQAGKEPPEIAFVFAEAEWSQEVGRLRERSPARAQAERARRQIEEGREPVDLFRCKAEGDDGTRLPGCAKVYVPLGRQGASAAPFGFVFQVILRAEGLAWAFLAFGERHPDDPDERTVYERAHKRLHGRYP